MAWEGILPAVLIGGAFMATSYGMELTHNLFNEGRIRRVNRDKFDRLIDSRDERLRDEKVLVRQQRGVYGVNEKLLDISVKQ